MNKKLEELKVAAEDAQLARIVAYNKVTTKATPDARDAYISACRATDIAWDAYTYAQTAD